MKWGVVKCYIKSNFCFPDNFRLLQPLNNNFLKLSTQMNWEIIDSFIILSKSHLYGLSSVSHPEDQISLLMNIRKQLGSKST